MQVGEEGDYNYTYRYSHHQNDPCVKMGSDETRFNVSLIVRGKSHKTMSTDHNLFFFFFFEEKGEPKRIRTEAPSLTSLMPYR